MQVAIPIEAPEGLAASGLGAILCKLDKDERDKGEREHTVSVEDGPNDPKEKTHKSQSDGKRPPSTESLDTEEDENGGGDNL